MDYYSLPGLSASGLKDLAISPLRYWHKWVNPQREQQPPTDAMILGTALHCKVLEPAEFGNRFCGAFDPPEDCLRTIADLRDFLKCAGYKASASSKAELVEQVLGIDEDAPVYDALKARYDAANEGKTPLSYEYLAAVEGMAESLMEEPEMQRLLSSGEAEKQYQVTGPHDVPLKARMDWVRPDCTLDLKTFAARRDEPIDREVSQAVWHRGYWRQAYFYSLVRAIAEGDGNPQTAPPFVFAFVESTPPYEVRIRQMAPKVGGMVNMLWEHARVQVDALIELYAECVDEFGERPWRYARAIQPLSDEDCPALLYR